MNTFIKLIDKLEKNNCLSLQEYVKLISFYENAPTEYLFERSNNARHLVYGNDIYIRGLIEISNICKNDCLYCGIRKSNKNIHRYRLSKKEILQCCESGYKLGFRTFVLQGAEDSFFDDDALIDIVSSIKNLYKDCAVTLSLGERSFKSYEALFNAGANRYLLRHETATDSHYKMLHPVSMSFENRISCLKNLKKIGFQTGCGFMVGSPYQTLKNIASDLKFIELFSPDMVGIGPFISQKDTPFANKPNGSVKMTLLLLAIIRLINPSVLLPATTALATLDKNGYKNGILAGANVIMVNLSPLRAKENYSLYDKKVCIDQNVEDVLENLYSITNKLGYNIIVSKGDHKKLLTTYEKD